MDFIVASEDAGTRLDRFLAEQLPDLSRTRVQELIAEGRVRVNGAAGKASQRVGRGDRVEAEAAARPPLRAEAEEIPLDVLYEDADVVVVNKPAGMVVHAGAGKASQHGTLVNALLGRYGKLSAGSEESGLRPGIVHRLDKETSGVIVVARNDAAHAALAEQFQSRTVQKTYVALVHGELKPAGRIELPIARDLKRRMRMVAQAGRGREARTEWRVLLVFGGSDSCGDARAKQKLAGSTHRNPPLHLSLAEVAIHTGRTHQIRAHFAALKHPVVGDEIYGAPARVRLGAEELPALGRNFLHAACIRFLHPRTGVPVEVRAALPAELRNYLELAAKACGVEWKQIDAAAKGYL